MTEAKYLVLANWIKEHIALEKYQRGDRFYTEGELAAMFGVSRLTVRQAVGLLVNENRLERRRGSGTFVASGVERQAEAGRIIGVITAYTDYVFSGVLQSIETTLANHGYAMQLAFTLDQDELERQALASMLSSRLAGILYVHSKNVIYNPNIPLLKEIEKKGIPLIQLFSRSSYTKFPYIALDDVAAGKIAVDHLISAGHKEIAGLFMSDTMQGILRYEGYARALCGAGITPNPRHSLWFTQEESDSLFNGKSRLVERLEGCTGLLCLNDFYACRMIKLLEENGIYVPDDISIVSVDNSDLAEHGRVPLTSVEHPNEAIGVKAAENIVRLIKDPGFDATKVFAPKLIERKSVRRILRSTDTKAG